MAATKKKKKKKTAGRSLNDSEGVVIYLQQRKFLLLNG